MTDHHTGRSVITPTPARLALAPPPAPAPAPTAAATNGAPAPLSYVEPGTLISLDWNPWLEHFNEAYRERIGREIVKTLQKILSTKSLMGEFTPPGPGCVLIGVDYVPCSDNGEPGMMRVEKYLCGKEYVSVPGPCIVPQGK